MQVVQGAFAEKSPCSDSLRREQDRPERIEDEGPQHRKQPENCSDPNACGKLIREPPALTAQSLGPDSRFIEQEIFAFCYS